MVFRKLKNCKGESLAETLISILIMALGIILLAGMVQSSSNVIVRSDQAIKERTLKENSLVKHEGYEGSAKSGDYRVKLSISNGAVEAVKFNKDESSLDVRVDLYEVEYGNTPIIAFKVK